MFLAESLSDFYLDLKDPRFVSRYAIFHQRFSTNTAPSWDLAQPFRALAHNGEINTLKGNVNWMKVHEEEMFSPVFEDMENLKPVIPGGNSDSASLDNVFELLNISGQPAPLAKLMLIPDAWSKKSKVLPAEHQKLFNFLNSTMEPWDGPAAIAATDNEWVIVATDRNGLRPMRYTITKDNLLFAGSETGMIELNEKKIVSKGRLGPGEILGVRIEKGKIFKNKEIKNYLAKEYKHFNNQIIDLDKKFPIKNETNLLLVANKGYDEKYGARPLNRAIQKHIEDPLAEEIIQKNVKEGDLIKIDLDSKSDKIKVSIVEKKKSKSNKT